MLQRLAQLFGVGKPPVAQPAQANDPAALAKLLAAKPSSLSELARRVAPSELPALIAALEKRELIPDLIAKTLEGRSASPELLQKLAASLTPLEREAVLAKLPAALQASAAKAGFDPFADLELGPTTGADVARVAAKSDKIPPLLQAVAGSLELEARVADVRAGRSAVSVAERAELRELLGQLDQGQLKALRELLVERPPHPQLKRMREHPALKGPPTASGVLAILVGEPLGLSPKASPELVKQAKDALAEYPYKFAPGVAEQWIDVLSQSPMAIRLVRSNGPKGLEAVNALGVANLEAAGHPWAEGRTLMRMAEKAPGGFAELRAFADARGPDAFGDALKAIGRASETSGLVDTLAKTHGFEAAARLAEVATPHTMRCLVHLSGGEEAAVSKLAGKSSAAMKRVLDEAGAKIKEFGDGGVALELGASWPKSRVKTPSIARAEAQVLSSLGLKSLDGLSDEKLGEVSRAMKAEIRRRSPAQADQLERELLGRRFVAGRYYDALYDAGVKNPEHRYSVETFESWKLASDSVLRLAKATRGRPLSEGELTEVMREAHRLAGGGMVGKLEQSHLKSEDLGRLRSKREDHVQLGNGFAEVDRKTAELLDKNPYLTPSLMRTPDDGSPTTLRQIVFAPGVDVPKMVADLDAFVRQNEGKMAPHELAAEVHFRLVSIHPFMDGNGRTAKLMADFVLARAGIEPPVWKKGDVMKNVETWPDAVREGVRYELDIVKRHFDAVVDAGAKAELR